MHAMHAMTVDPTTPVGKLAARLPFIVRILEDRGIDYHLGGAQTLQEACAAVHASLEQVLGHMQTAIARTRAISVDWMDAPLPDLLTHIVDGHHSFTRDLCRRLRADLAVAFATQGTAYGLKPLGVAFDAFEDELLTHLDREETVVFPYIRVLARGERPRGGFTTVEYPIRIIGFEHESQEDWLRELRRLTDHYSPPPGSCGALRAVCADLASLERDIHEHLHLENNVLFPRAGELERDLRAETR